MLNSVTEQTNELRQEKSAFLDFSNRPSATRIYTGTNPETGEKDFDYDYLGYRIEKNLGEELGYFIRKHQESTPDEFLGKVSHWTLTVRDAKSIIDTLVDVRNGKKVAANILQSLQMRKDAIEKEMEEFVEASYHNTNAEVVSEMMLETVTM